MCPPLAFSRVQTIEYRVSCLVNVTLARVLYKAGYAMTAENRLVHGDLRTKATRQQNSCEPPLVRAFTWDCWPFVMSFPGFPESNIC